MQKTRRKLWTWSITIGTSLLVAAALVTGLFRLAVQVTPTYKEDIANYVSDFLNRPVSIEAMDLSWRGVRPTLVFSGVSLLATSEVTPVLELEELQLGFSPSDLIRGKLTPSAINLVGAVIELERRADGRIFVHGLDAGEPGEDDTLGRRLSAIDRLRVSRSQLIWRDRKRGLPDYWFRDVDLRVTRARPRAGQPVLDLRLEAHLPPALQGSGQVAITLVGDPASEQWSAQGDYALEGLTPGPWLDAWAGRRLQVQGDALQASGELQLLRAPGASVVLTTGGQLETAALWHGQRTQGVDALQAGFDLSLSGEGLDVQLTDLTVDSARESTATGPLNWAADRLALRWQGSKAAWQATAEVTDAELADLMHWLPVLAGASAPGEPLDALHGRVRGLQLSAGQQAGAPVQFTVTSQFSRLGFPSTATRTGVQGLKGSLTADQAGGRANLDEAPLRIDAPRHVATPIVVDAIDAVVEWTQAGPQWAVNLREVDATLHGARLQGSGGVTQPATGHARLRVDARVSSRNATTLKPLMPLKWSDKLRGWLDRAIVRGRVPAGTLMIDAPLIKDPDDPIPGRFELDLQLADTTLQFAPDWPAVEGITGRLTMDDDSLRLDAEQARTGGVPVGRTQASIADLHGGQRLLDITLGARAPAQVLLEYLAKTPLRTRMVGLQDTLFIDGDALVDLDLEVPLRNTRAVAVNGAVTFGGVEVRYTGIDAPYRDMFGTVSFDNRGIRADTLKGILAGVPVRLSIGPVPGQAGVTALDFTTRVNLAQADAPWSRHVPAWIARAADGASDWTVSARVGGQADASTLSVYSALQGTRLDLPAPLNKPDPTTRLPVMARLQQGPDEQWRVTGQLGGRLAYAARVEQQTLVGGHLALGSSTPPPSQPGFSVTGTLPALDLGAWQGATREAGDDKGGGTPPPDLAIDVSVDTLQWGQTTLQPQRVAGGRDSAAWALSLRGAADGRLTWDGAADDPVIIRLQQLRMPALVPRTADTSESAAPATPEPAAAPIQPAALPIIDLEIDRLTVGDVRFGRTILRTERRAHGLTLRQLSVDGDSLNGRAQGYWVRSDGVSRGGIDGAFSSSRVSDVMDALGFVETVRAKQSRASVDLAWPESPDGLDWTRATGSIDIGLNDGVLSTVEPGAGRMLGLLSFNALPRRLLLDFRDVVDSGLTFDGIDGRFRVGGGRAQTDDLEVRTPSLTIQVEGVVGLADRTYDQTITVQPDVSSGLTLAGTVFGGPAVGAILLVAQELFDKPLNQASQLAYHLGGTWDDPVVTRPNQAPEAPAEPDPPSSRGPRS